MKITIERDLNELATILAKAEKGKKQIDIAQVKEMIKLLGIMISYDFELAVVLAQHGRESIYNNLYPEKPETKKKPVTKKIKKKTK